VKNPLDKKPENRTPADIEAIVKANIGLVVKFVKNYSLEGKTSPTHEWEDMEQEAYFALIRAAQTYRRGHTGKRREVESVLFSTYASQCIINQLNNVFRKDMREMGGDRRHGGAKVPTERVASVYSYEGLAESYKGSDGESMHPDELEFMGGGDHSDWTVEEERHTMLIKAARARLQSEQERYIFDAKLEGKENVTIADELGLSRERVRQVWQKITLRLQQSRLIKDWANG
jgi:RNA polymerase sigma factor (sigma-70 family)